LSRPWDRHLRREPGWVERTLPFVLLALVLHVAGGVLGDGLFPLYTPRDRGHLSPASLVILEPPPKDEDEEDPPEPELDGQLVEIARPQDPQRPEDSEYLAEFDATVEEETRTDAFKINPEVVAPEYSHEDKMEQEDLVDLQLDKPSTGAQVGNDRFDPDRDGNLAALPSPHAKTNRDGVQDPVPASHTSSALSGAPQNDLLDEKLGDRVSLNTREYLYAEYLQRIRRLVNFYWEQNIDNLPSSTPMVKSAYTTGVEVVLDGNGALEIIEVVDESGSEPLDDCVVRAFKLAGPFPNPPEGLIEKDGRVYLPDMAFTVRQGTARARYEGVDPRAGVQFPGIHKSPR
jgi:hypothetical protein